MSDFERDGPLKEVLWSTSGVIFLGSPHRATEHSTLADAIKSMAAITFRVDSHDLVLHHLCGASSVEAELGRKAFARLWNDYNFKVKTFQESIIPSYRFLDLRAEAVSWHRVPCLPWLSLTKPRRFAALQASSGIPARVPRPSAPPTETFASSGPPMTLVTERWPAP